jgi:peroxiredoxin Q/BCP
VVAGISPDPVAKLGKFQAKHGLASILLADEENLAASDYGVWVEKSMYGKKYMGVERTTFLIGKDGKIVKVFRKVKPAGHAEQVLAEMSALGMT